MGRRPCQQPARRRVAFSFSRVPAGDDFLRSYGWASGYLNGKPDFDAIQAAVGLEHWFPQYKLASQEIHANAKPLYWNLAAGRQDKYLLVGPSNEGLAEAVHPIILSLNMVSAALVNECPGGRRALALKVLGSLAEQVGASLLESHERVERAKT